MDDDLRRRARMHAALGEPVRLAIVDELATSDRSPSELTRRSDLPSNLLAHHLDVLQTAGIVERFESSADRRRRYVRLLPDRAPAPAPRAPRARASALFVCSHNSARSQLAAALWTLRTGGPAHSAGTRPARRVHPGAVAAARRVGLDLTGAVPHPLGVDDTARADLVVTVCDRAHEELAPPDAWWHWSIPDPVPTGTDAAFDDALAHLDDRIRSLTGDPPTDPISDHREDAPS